MYSPERNIYSFQQMNVKIAFNFENLHTQTFN